MIEYIKGRKESRQLLYAIRRVFSEIRIQDPEWHPGTWGVKLVTRLTAVMGPTATSSGDGQSCQKAHAF